MTSITALVRMLQGGDIQEVADGGLLRFLSGGRAHFAAGAQIEAPYSGLHVARAELAAEGTPANGGMVAWANPMSVPILAFRPILRVTTPATGSATADIGTASDDSTSSDNLFDGVDIGAAAADFDAGAGTNGEAFGEVAATGFITGTAGADSSGLEGYLLIPFIPLYAVS